MVFPGKLHLLNILALSTSSPVQLVEQSDKLSHLPITPHPSNGEKDKLCRAVETNRQVGLPTEHVLGCNRRAGPVFASLGHYELHMVTNDASKGRNKASELHAMTKAGQELVSCSPNLHQTGVDVTDNLPHEDRAGPECGPHNLQGNDHENTFCKIIRR